MAAYTCTVCTLDYPVAIQYIECIQCGLKTHYRIARKAMAPEKLEALKKANAPSTDDEVTQIRVEAEHRFATFYEYAIKEAERRNAIGGDWSVEDILEELLDQQEAA